MTAAKMQAAIMDVVAGTSLIMVGLAGALVRLGVLDWARLPQWSAMEHWWPLLLIIAGLVTWLAEMEEVAMSPRPRRPVEMPYGK